ncbi:MAG: hypothetical protein NWQ95_03815, partial [Verrucomicrobiales bacterium]|nr:hypothetical protein [Verrucomicrobiales bacterium]
IEPSASPAAARPALKITETAGLFRPGPDEEMPDRVVFILDVSRSLTPAQFAMSKAELLGGLDSLRIGAFYQVIFFSGPAWFAHQRLVSGGERGEVLLHVGDTGGAGHLAQPQPGGPRVAFERCAGVDGEGANGHDR